MSQFIRVQHTNTGIARMSHQKTNEPLPDIDLDYDSLDTPASPPRASQGEPSYKDCKLPLELQDDIQRNRVAMIKYFGIDPVKLTGKHANIVVETKITKLGGKRRWLNVNPKPAKAKP